MPKGSSRAAVILASLKEAIAYSLEKVIAGVSGDIPLTQRPLPQRPLPQRPLHPCRTRALLFESM